MQTRPLSAALEASLLSTEPFVYYHLVKFERPKPSLADGTIGGFSTDYTYITDAPYNVEWDDGSVDVNGNTLGVQTYIPNKLESVGGVQETIEARASTMSLKISTTALGALVSDVITLARITNSGDNPKATGSIEGTYWDFIEYGFREGDKVQINGSNNVKKSIIITGFTKSSISQFENSKIWFKSEESDLTVVGSPTAYSLTLISEELNAPIYSKEEPTLYSNYINREVYVYRAHANPVTGAMTGEPFLLFKGIISNASIEERPDKSSYINWSLTSHWADFVRVQGRITSDAAHRALDLTGRSDRDALLKPEYETDYGFIHAERSVNVLATYTDKEIRYRTSSKWGGLVTKTKEYYIDVQREVDLRFNLAAKFLPVIYGVRKVSGNPVFADIPWRAEERNFVFVAYALCEGELSALYDIYIEGEPSICANYADYDFRSRGGGTDSENSNVLCIGRADRGAVLYGAPYIDPNVEPISTASGPLIAPLETAMLDIRDGIQIGGFGYWSVVEQRWISNYNPYSGDDLAGSSKGLLHEQYYTFEKPTYTYLVFHAGKSDQAGDAMLMHKASELPNGNFKIQNDYFEGNTVDYWSPSHRLCDTAYVAARFEIAPGETTVPELEFIVKGKFINCHNYDYSFKHNPNWSSEDPNNFDLGDAATISLWNGSSWSSPVATQIIDKWTLTDEDGNDDVRFRVGGVNGPLDLELDGISQVLLASGGNNWHMHTDSSIIKEGSVIPILPASYTDYVYSTDGEYKISITFKLAGDADSNVVHSILSNFAPSVIPNIAIALLDYPNYMFAIRSYDVGTKTIVAVPSQGAAYYLNEVDSSGTPKFFLANIVKVPDYTGITSNAELEISRKINGVPQRIVKDVIDRNTVDDVILVRGAFPSVYIPGLNHETNYTALTEPDTFKAYFPRDKRVSINPAIQLLDYITDRRYGKGLNIDKDLNKIKWLESARLCDDRSKVKVACQNEPQVGDVYRYTAGSFFQGTVSSVVFKDPYYEVEFDNVIGKLGYKWNDWRDYNTNDLVWGYDKTILAPGGTITKVAFGSASPVTSVQLPKVQGSGPTNLTVDTSYLNGVSGTNTVVRAWTQGEEWSNPGYSLHDSDDVVYWKYLGWDEQEQRYVTRHQMNQVIETSTPLFDNINSMLVQFNGILRYTNGLYELDIKTGAPDISDPYWEQGVTVISENDIIGNIRIDDKGQKDSFNKVAANIVDPQNKFNARSVSFFNSQYLKEDKGVPKEGTYALPGITNYYAARTNIVQFLDESRYGLTISFTMDQKGYLLLAGNVIAISYARFNWDNKQFRIQTLTTRADGLVSIVAREHKNDAYLIDYTDRAPGDSEGPGNEGSTPPKLDRPTGLTATQDLEGEIRLNWINSEDYDRTKHRIEIWAVEAPKDTLGNYTEELESDGETWVGNVWALASFLGDAQGDYWVHDGFDEDPKHIWFYWIRYVKPATKPNETAKYSLFYPYNFNPGVMGQAGAGTADGYTFLWTNQSVQVFRDSTGAIGNLNPTAFEFAVYKGSTALTPVNSPTPAAGEFTIALTGMVDGIENPAPPNSLVPDADPFLDPAPIDNVIQVGPVTSIGDGVSFGQVRIDLNIEGQVWVPSLYQNIYVTILGSDAWNISGTNTYHTFQCDETGYVDPIFRDFQCVFTVIVGATEYTYDDSTYPDPQTFHYGTITSSANIIEVIDGGSPPNPEIGEITLDAASGIYTSAVSDTGYINVPILDYQGTQITSKTIQFFKKFSGIRGGAEFLIQGPIGNITSANIAAWSADPFTDNVAAKNIGMYVINNLSPDGYLRPNDRITVVDAAANQAGSRIFQQASTYQESAISAASFSTLVVEVFHGSVIVDGTLSADKLVANFLIANNARISSNLVIGDQVDPLNSAGQLYSWQKTSFNDPDAGFYMNEDGQFVVGDSNSYIRFDPTGVGTVEFKGSLIVGGNYHVVTWNHGSDIELSSTNMGVRKVANGGVFSATGWVRSNTAFATGSTATLVPSSATVECVFGLSSAQFEPTIFNVNGGQIDWGFKLNSNGVLNLWKNGSIDISISVPYASGDHLQVVYQGTTVYFYQGETLLNTHSNPGGEGDTYFWEGGFATSLGVYSTLSIGFKEAPNPKGTSGLAGAGMFLIVEPIPDATPLADFKDFISVNGIDTGGSGGILGATGRDYAVRGDICVVKDPLHPDGSPPGTGERVAAFICNKDKWVDADGIDPYWIPPEAFIDGDLVVDGTIHGRALRIYGVTDGSGIYIGENDKQRIDIYSDSNLRVRLGDLVST